MIGETTSGTNRSCVSTNSSSLRRRYGHYHSRATTHQFNCGRSALYEYAQRAPTCDFLRFVFILIYFLQFFVFSQSFFVFPLISQARVRRCSSPRWTVGFNVSSIFSVYGSLCLPHGAHLRRANAFTLNEALCGGTGSGCGVQQGYWSTKLQRQLHTHPATVCTPCTCWCGCCRVPRAI